MTIIFTHKYALRCWMEFAGRHIKRPALADTPLTSTNASSDEILTTANLLAVPGLIEVISMPSRTNGNGIIYHRTSSALPEESFCQISDGVYICRPELLFVQLCNGLDLIKAIRIGYTLTAKYTLINGEIIDIKPITTVENIAAYIENHSNIKGSSIAKSAIKYIQNEAASKRELQTSMLLSAPRRLGGYGLPLSILNFTVIGKKYQKGNRTVDLYWPEYRLALEYESNECHSGSADLERDSIRRNVIKSHGIDVVTLTNAELVDPEKFDVVAKYVAKRLGVRIKGFRKDRHMELRTILDL